MPPTSDGIRTVGCSLQKLVPDAGQLDAIRQAVASTHRATIHATELLNIHLRRMLTVGDADLSVFFNASWLLNAYNEVTTGKRKVKVVESLHQTYDSCMPPFSPPDRTGIQQCLLYDARNLATVAATGVCTFTSASSLMFVGRLRFRMTSMQRFPRTKGIDASWS